MTTFSCFSSRLITALEEIFHGQHNDANCKKWQEKHERIHGKVPQPCKFKDNHEEIPKLLEKLVIGTNGDVQVVQRPEKPE